MTNFLFATFHAGGNLPPIVGIGRELQSRGHTVRVLGDRTQREPVIDAGLEFIAYAKTPKWIATQERSDLVAGWSTLNTATSGNRASEVVNHAKAFSADIVVIDCVLLSTFKAVAEAGLTHVALYHFFYHYADHPLLRLPLTAATRMLGVPHRTLWGGADLGIVCTDRELDPTPPHKHLHNVVWTGVVQNAIPVSESPPGRRVLASLSTISYRGMTTTWQRILDAVRGTDIELIATTGPAIDRNALDIPSNVTVYEYYPHDELMQICSVVISHGGHATTTRALGYGLPVVVLPMHPMLDQPMVGRAVVDAGVGAMLGKTTSPEGIRAAVMKMLDDPHYRRAAGDVGRRIRSTNGAAAAAAELLALDRPAGSQT